MFSPRPTPDAAGPGQESVWDYPRPPRLERVEKRLEVRLAGVTIADTTAGYRTLETSHPPTYYFPPDDVTAGVLRPAGGGSVCEWKGVAAYFDAVVTADDGSEVAADGVAWGYPRPTGPFAAIADFVAFYLGGRFGTEGFVDGVPAEPQPGGFYGGWVTPDVVGPFKGWPGSLGW
ncbi:MAG: DUF427 domain-containing protein [Planctomycetota bacterium]